MDFASIDRRNAVHASADTAPPEKPARDPKRVVLIIGLGALSWVATYVGMLELIEANMGDLPLVHRIIIGFSVAMLMTMIIWLLDQMFKPQSFSTRAIYAAGYVFLSIISIGFGFGFYWKVLESRGESSRSAENAVSQVQNALHGASTRLEQLQATLAQLTTVSTEKAELERTKGTSCPNSRPGDGPRRKMRDEDAQRFGFASEFVKGRVGAVKTDMTALNGDLVKIASADPATFDAKTGTRNEFMKALSRKLDMTVTGFNAFRTDPQLTQIRSDLSDRAERTTFSDGRNGTVSCPDPQLQAALRGVVKAIDQLPELTKPEIAAVEGSEATIEAFRRLTATFYGMLAFKLPPSADELRDLQKRAVQSVENPNSAEVRAARTIDASEAGLSKRDYVPLAVAVFVDLCLLLVSMVQRNDNRIDRLMPKMQAAERGPVIQILSRFNDIHRDQEVRDKFEIFRHVVFDMNGDYYVAVPLDAPPRLNPKEREELRIEAQLLSNLFASFEKEKIFKRTILPTTGSIQKRLARQGSKFAGSEAFRVYKFADGAWSDIILGAVMGAARRIEDEYRSGVRARQSPPGEIATTGKLAMRGDGAMHEVIAMNMDAHPNTADPHALAWPLKTANGPPLPADPDHRARFGPYANAYRPEPALSQTPNAPRVVRPEPRHPEAEVSVKAAAQSAAGARDAASSPQDRQTAEKKPRARILPLPRSPFWKSNEEDSNEHKPSAEPNPLREALANVAVNREPAIVAMSKNLSERLENTRATDVPAIRPEPLSAADRALIERMAPPAAE